MKIKYKYLVAACMAMGASSAFAAAAPTACVTTDTTDPITAVVTPAAANLVNTCTPEFTLYIAGASALGGAITQVAPADLFDGVFTLVKDDGSPNGNLAGAAGAPKAVTAWYGTAKTGLGAASGKKLFVVYNKQNGSAAGISQLLSPIKDTTIPEQDVVTIGPFNKLGAAGGVVATTQATSVGGANTCTAQADTLNADLTVKNHNVTCTTHGRTQADLGFSDVRPDMLFALEGAKPKKFSTLNFAPIALQGFGVAVNANLYAALQTKQIADGRLPGTCTAGDLTGACQPSIRKADYASLISTEGTIKSAADLLNDPADTTLLTLARRDDLSGTQASSNIFFADNACGASLDSKGKAIKGVLGGMLHILDTSPDVTKLVIHPNATTDGVKADLGTSATVPTAGYAIGVVSLDSAETSRAAGNMAWKFVKIDGQSPNFSSDGVTVDTTQRQAAIKGNYPFVVASYAATQIKPFSKTSVVTTSPELVAAMIIGMKDSTLHNLRGIGYLDGAADPSILDGINKQAHYIRTAGNSCSPLIKM